MLFLSRRLVGNLNRTKNMIQVCHGFHTRVCAFHVFSKGKERRKSDTVQVKEQGRISQLEMASIIQKSHALKLEGEFVLQVGLSRVQCKGKIHDMEHRNNIWMCLKPGTALNTPGNDCSLIYKETMLREVLTHGDTLQTEKSSQKGSLYHCSWPQIQVTKDLLAVF